MCKSTPVFFCILNGWRLSEEEGEEGEEGEEEEGGRKETHSPNNRFPG